MIGDDALPIIKEATTFSPDAWTWLDGWLKKNYGVSLTKAKKKK